MKVLGEWLEPHLDELGPLLRLRQEAEEDRRFTLGQVQELEQRIAAHLEALALYDDLALRSGDDLLPVCAALLRRGASCGDLLQALPAEEVEALRPLGSSALRGDGVRWALLAGRMPEPTWFIADDPWTRRWAWLLSTGPVPDAEESHIVRAALRQCVPRWRGGSAGEQLLWDARIASANEAPVLAEQCWCQDPVPVAVLAALGRPADATELIPLMIHPDPAQAVAAGRAFTVITGAGIDSDVRVTLPPDNGSIPDDFAAAFLEQAWLPDQARARAAAQRLPVATRLNRGFPVDDGKAAAHPGIDRFEAASAAARRRRLG